MAFAPGPHAFAELCIFVGAGISLPAPSSLPLFAGIRRAIAIELGVRENSALGAIAPETLLHYLQVADVPISELLQTALSSSSPNAVHFALAEAISRKIDVWTPNADELIEQAMQALGQTASIVYGKTPAHIPTDSRLFKVHGTITRPDTLAFRTQEVLDPIGPKLLQRLAASVTGKTVLICGYAGADPDIRPALIQTLPSARAIKWFELPSGLPAIERRYEKLHASRKLEIIASNNPSLSFFRELHVYGIGPAISSTLVGELSVIRPRPIDLRHLQIRSKHFAAAHLYELIGKSNRAIARYRKGTRSGTTRQRLRCSVQLYSAGLYYQKPWAAKLRSAIKWAASSKLSFPWTSKAISVNARLLEREGQYEEAYLTAEQALALQPSSPDRTLDVCAAARKTGHLLRALDLSRAASSQLRHGQNTEGKTIARALYEQAYALRLAGSHKEALSVISELNDNLDIYGGPNWRAWGLCQQGCTLVQATRRYDEAISILAEAVQWFQDLGDPYKVTAVQSNLCTAYRAAGRYGEARVTINAARDQRATLAYQSVFENEVLAFEIAELDRIDGMLQNAHSQYDELCARSKLPIHRALAHLGLASIDRHWNSAPNHATKALNLAKTIDFRFGMAHAHISLAKCGQQSWDAAVKQVDALDVFAFSVDPRSFERGQFCDQVLLFPS